MARLNSARGCGTRFSWVGPTKVYSLQVFVFTWRLPLFENKKTCYFSGTMSFPRSSFVQPSVPRLDTNTDHSIEIGMFPDLYRDIHIPWPAHWDVRFPDLHRYFSLDSFWKKTLQMLMVGMLLWTGGETSISMSWSGKLISLWTGQESAKRGTAVGQTTIGQKT